MHRFTLSFLVAVLLPAAALALAWPLELESALREADLIARIKIVSTTSTPADSGYRQLAQAIVTQAVKGPKVGETIRLLFDNGLTCPNVFYKANEDCIIFGKRTPKGDFETMNTYAGQFPIRDGLVENFYLLGEIEPGLSKTAKPENIIAVLRRLIIE